MENADYSILVVDDEEGSREINETILADAGYRVTLAKDGVEGWEKFLSGDFDLIVIDRVMPKMSGDELARRIRNDNHRIPIIMLTAMDRQEDVEIGVKLGIDQYIHKAHLEFARDLATWAANLTKRYRQSQTVIKEVKIKATRIFHQSKELLTELKKTKMSSYNMELFLNFAVIGISWKGDYETLGKELVKSIESLDFPGWEKLKASLLIEVNGQTTRIGVGQGSKTERAMKRAFKTFFVEFSNVENRESVPVVWSLPWETHEKDEGISLLIQNLPPDRMFHQIEAFDDIRAGSLRETVQGTIYRFFEYAAGMIGNYEVQRKFKELVSVASDNLNSAIQEMENNRQFQVELFDSLIAELGDLNVLKLASEEHKELKKILDRKFNVFQQLEMTSLNDIQKLLKWVRSLQKQFDETEETTLSDEADAKQIGGNQADVEKLLADFNL